MPSRDMNYCWGLRAEIECSDARERQYCLSFQPPGTKGEWSSFIHLNKFMSSIWFWMRWILLFWRCIGVRLYRYKICIYPPHHCFHKPDTPDFSQCAWLQSWAQDGVSAPGLCIDYPAQCWLKSPPVPELLQPLVYSRVWQGCAPGTSDTPGNVELASLGICTSSSSFRGLCPVLH